MNKARAARMAERAEKVYDYLFKQYNSFGKPDNKFDAFEKKRLRTMVSNARFVSLDARAVWIAAINKEAK